MLRTLGNEETVNRDDSRERLLAESSTTKSSQNAPETSHSFLHSLRDHVV